MVSTTTALQLVHNIYEAADGQVAWPKVLADISDSLNGGVAALLYHDLTAKHGSLNESVRLSPEGVDVYQRYFHTLDPWARATGERGLGKTGAVLHADQLIPFQSLRRTEYYADYARQHELVRILAGVVIASGPVLSVISVLRSETQQPFGAEEERLLALLMPHLRRVLEIRSKMDGLQLMQAVSAEALDRVSSGIVLVDRDGQVLLTNRAAERILSSGEGLKVVAGKIGTSLRADDAPLLALIAAAASTCSGSGLHPGGTLAVTRPNRMRPLSVTVTPLSRRAMAETTRHPVAALFVSDPDDLPVPADAVLRCAFGLTAAESRLVMALCGGESIADAATRLGITRETARTYLKRAFLKTGTSRQGELIALGSRLALRQPQTR